MRARLSPIMLGGEGGVEKSQASLSWQTSQPVLQGGRVCITPPPPFAGMPPLNLSPPVSCMRNHVPLSTICGPIFCHPHHVPPAPFAGLLGPFHAASVDLISNLWARSAMADPPPPQGPHRNAEHEESSGHLSTK